MTLLQLGHVTSNLHFHKPSNNQTRQEGMIASPELGHVTSENSIISISIHLAIGSS